MTRPLLHFFGAVALTPGLVLECLPLPLFLLANSSSFCHKWRYYRTLRASGALREFQFAECTDLRIRVKRRFPGSIAADPCAIGATALPQIVFDRPAPLARTAGNLEFSTAGGIEGSFFHYRNTLGTWVG